MARRRRRSSSPRTCAVEGCARQVARGKVVCAAHGRTRAGREVQTAVQRLAGEMTTAAARVNEGRRDEEELAGIFRRRIEGGEYGALLEAPLRAVVRQAAMERTLAEEMGALRIAAKRLLMEEEDPARMALGLSRVTTALGRLMTREERLVSQRDRLAWEEMRRAEDAERGERRTIRSVVDEWWERSGPAIGERTDGGVGDGEEIIDLFSELRPGGWRSELPDEE
ncbi:MAG: hypothetical protein ACRDJW_21730 [Thermomicrobiales bacterium]